MASTSLTETTERRGRGRYSKAWTFGSEAHAGRKARAGAAGWLAVLEMADDEYVELDGDSAGHATRLAKDWLRNFGARSASVWRTVDGRLADRIALLDWRDLGEPA